MLHESKDMPKIQVITDQKSIDKYGGDRMYFAPPIEYDKIMKRIPYGKVITVGKIREYFAKLMVSCFFLQTFNSISSPRPFCPTTMPE